MFEDFEIEIHCPGCDTAMDVKLSQIAKKEKVTCPCCKHTIGLKPDAKSDPDKAKDADKPFESIQQTLNKLQGKSE